MQRASSMLTIALMLSGCGLAMQAAEQQRFNEASGTLASEQAACERQYPDRLKKPVTPRVKCLMNAFRKFQSNGPYADLAMVAAAKTELAAEHYDSGRISTAEYEVAIAQARAEAASAGAQRNNSSVAANAAASQAYAAQQQATISTMQALTPPRPVTCNRFGNSVTCQ